MSQFNLIFRYIARINGGLPYATLVQRIISAHIIHLTNEALNNIEI